MYEDRIPAWIGKHVEKLGKKISPDACVLLQSHVGRSLREIRNEIDKLFIFVGEKKTIESDDVNHVVGVSREYNIFELQKEALHGNTGADDGCGGISGRNDRSVNQIFSEAVAPAGSVTEAVL
jgi:DNA polymerase-3 subunit delta